MKPRWTQLDDHPWLGRLGPSLLVQSFPKDMSDEDLTAFLAAAEKLILALQTPYAWVVDVGGLLRATAKQRRMFAEFEDRTKEQDAKLCAGAAIYAPTAFTRGLVTAVFWLSPPAYPTKIVASFEEAEAWARAKLDERR